MQKKPPTKSLNQRVNSLFAFDRGIRQQGFSLLAGVDEAGRGPLAGPVVAAAVMLPADWQDEMINDSKLLSPKKRDYCLSQIQSHALAFGIGIIPESMIDSVNILQATYLAVKEAVQQMQLKPDGLVLDALKIDDLLIPQISIIKGDQQSLSIAAASIVAKVTRDRIMNDYDRQYPEYGFAKHKGYGTVYHYEALDQYGPCPIHRNSFLKKWKLDRENSRLSKA
jgi:ribonuclease HII